MALPDEPRRTSPEARAADVLNGWKEIAHYVGRSSRTAIRWATELGLPVHRMKGKVGEIVYAIPAEIDEWRMERSSTSTGGPPAEHALGATPFSAPIPIRSRLILIGLGVAALALLWWSVGSTRSAPIGGQPTTWSISDNRLTVFDARQVMLWEHRFPFALQPEVYAAPSSPYATPPLIRIADIEGDGTPEVVFVANTRVAPAENKVYVFEHDGRIRFQYSPVGPARFGAEDFGAPYTVRHLLAVGRPTGGTAIWIGASHIKWFPTVVEQLDARGGVRAQYWANGHVKTLAEVTMGDRRYLAVGGTSNEDRSAALALIDFEGFWGRAPSLDPSFRCVDCPQSDPVAYFLFPRTELSTLTDSRPFVAEVSQLGDGGLDVTVEQAVVPAAQHGDVLYADVHYRLSPDLRLTDFRLGDAYSQAHKALQALTLLDHSWGQGDLRVLSAVRQWDGSGYREVGRHLLAIADPRPNAPPLP